LTGTGEVVVDGVQLLVVGQRVASHLLQLAVLRVI